VVVVDRGGIDIYILEGSVNIVKYRDNKKEERERNK
jgi:hypothetical protein